MTGAVSTRQGHGAPDTRAAKRLVTDAPRFMLGDWLVDVHAHRLERGDESTALEPRLMAVLAEMCRRPGEVVGADALLDACWPGEVLGDNPVHKVMAGLRRSLQDSATAPRYIETIRKQGYRLVAPIRVLSDQGPRSHQAGWRGQSPFRGLESFGVEHASVFFGRDGAVAELHARLTAQWQRSHPLVVLLGPSGSGKTSLVQAGLLPALLAAPAKADVSRVAPLLRACTAGSVDLAAFADLGPWAALAGALLDWECADAPLLAGHSIESLALALREQTDEVLRLLRVGLAACQLIESEGAPITPPLLVLDRLEALFQAPAQAGALAFIACIERLVRSRLLLVLAVCRNDFYPSLADHAALMIDKEHGAHMDLVPPDADAFAQMIRRPARAAGLIYGTDASGMNHLDDRLCAEALHARDALPMLQYTLQALYLDRVPGNELTWAAYDSLGGLEGAIGRRAEATLLGLPPGPQEALTHLLPRFVVLSSEDASPTSRWVSGSSIAEEDERVLLHALVESRLLVADHVRGATGFRVAHEALLRRWPRVTAWVAQHRTTLVFQSDLMPWVRRWLEGARASALLLPRGAMLWQASAALAEAPRLFNDDERAFVARSLARVKRQARWRWAAVAGALCVAVLAGVVAARYAALAQVASERERQSQRLASFMLGDLADQLRPIGKLDLLSSIGEQALSLFGRRGTPAETPQDALQRAKALVVIGEVNSSRGKARTDIAIPALRQADELLEPLKHVPGLAPAEIYKTLGASAFWLGQIAFDADRFDEASAWMSRYRDACELWRRASPGDGEAAAELGYALSSLGAIAVRRAAWVDAERAFRDALALKASRAASAPGDVALRRSMADTTIWLGQLAYLRGAPGEALAHYARARTLGAPDGQSPEDANSLHNRGILGERESEALRASGRRTLGLQAMEAAAATLAEAGRRDPQNAWWAAEQIHAEAGLAMMRAEDGHDVAVDLRSLRARLRVGEKDASPLGSMLDAARLRLDVADALSARVDAASDPASALGLARIALSHGRALIARRPQAWQAAEDVSRLVLAEVLRSRRAVASRAVAPSLVAFCGDARDTLAPVVATGQAGLVLEGWIVARRCAGDTSNLVAETRRLMAAEYSPTAALGAVLP
jgi:DNA-binding winged helix-turn-helix (wHTH) protein/tetratricopeptide (TPR) repeat protein